MTSRHPRVWQVCLELNVPSLFAVGADPGDPHLRAESVPQGPKQSSYLRNRPVMRLRRPAMSVTRESMVRILIVVKFLACTPGARTNPRHWKAQCQAKEGTPLLRQTRTAGSSLCPIVEFSEVYEAPVVLSCSVEYPSWKDFVG